MNVVGAGATPTLSVDASHVSVAVLLFATVATTFAGVVGGWVSAPGGGGRISLGAVHGACGPPKTPAPFSKIVASLPSSGSAPSHIARDSASRARVMSRAPSVYVAVHLLPLGLVSGSTGSYAIRPSPGARSVRAPLRLNWLPGDTSRCSSCATSIGLPFASAAVPWTSSVFAPVWTGRWAVTLATTVSSTWPAFGPESIVMRTMSPGRMSGVEPTQQAPPGWLTSTMPSKPSVPGSSCGTRPVTVPTGVSGALGWTISTVTVSVWAYPSADTKSRCGNAVITCGGVGAWGGQRPAGPARSDPRREPQCAWV